MPVSMARPRSPAPTSSCSVRVVVQGHHHAERVRVTPVQAVLDRARARAAPGDATPPTPHATAPAPARPSPPRASAPPPLRHHRIRVQTSIHGRGCSSRSHTTRTYTPDSAAADLRGLPHGGMPVVVQVPLDLIRRRHQRGRAVRGVGVHGHRRHVRPQQIRRQLGDVRGDRHMQLRRRLPRRDRLPPEHARQTTHQATPELGRPIQLEKLPGLGFDMNAAGPPYTAPGGRCPRSTRPATPPCHRTARRTGAGATGSSRTAAAA
jgi:hypothetical protein